MEDEFICDAAFGGTWKDGKTRAVFGVFDGHGGRECATFVKNVLPIAILESRELLRVWPSRAIKEGILRVCLIRAPALKRRAFPA